MLSGDHESQRPRGADRKDQYRRSVDQYRIKCGFYLWIFRTSGDGRAGGGACDFDFPDHRAWMGGDRVASGGIYPS